MPFLKSLSPKLIKNRISLLVSYLKRNPISKGLPVELALELTNHCNADCIMCPRHKMTRSKGFMDFSLFKKIVDEIKDYTELVFLHLAGEPLLHPDLIKIINYCGKNGLNSALSTNAILLDAKKSEDLINSSLDLLVLSFDGTTKETYERIRRKADFDSTYRNIERFLDIKSKSKKSPYSEIQLIYQKENFKEAKDFLLKWRKSKVDMVRIKPYFNYPGLDEYLGKIPKRTRKCTAPCFLLWRQLTIYWDGTAVACCQDFLSKMVVGDANKDSIKDIWNGEKMRKMRQIHKQGEYDRLSLCKDCTMPQLSLPMLLGSIFFHDLAMKKLIPMVERLAILRNIERISYFS